jgi:hypothetical protein
MLWLEYVLIYVFFYKVHQIKRYPEIRKKWFVDRTIELVGLSNVLIGVPAIKNSMARPSLLYSTVGLFMEENKEFEHIYNR